MWWFLPSDHVSSKLKLMMFSLNLRILLLVRSDMGFTLSMSIPTGRCSLRAHATQPLVREADPELEKLLDEEEAIAQREAAKEEES